MGYLTISTNIRRYEEVIDINFIFQQYSALTDSYYIQHSPTATVQNAHFSFFLATAQNSAELNSNDEEI